VLPLRFALFASLGAIALWGLFSLLDNLKQPELLRSPRLIVVKGCDAIETTQARQTCGQLRCEKAILDAKLAPLRAAFEITDDLTAHEERLIGGLVQLAAQAPKQFACVLQGEKVVQAALIEAEELDALLNLDGEWELEPAD
jgi:hypothetical protein